MGRYSSVKRATLSLQSTKIERLCWVREARVGREPPTIDPRDPVKTKDTQLEALRKENEEPKAQLIETNRIMQKLLAKLS
jgi:hypothetical protein